MLPREQCERISLTMRNWIIVDALGLAFSTLYWPLVLVWSLPFTHYMCLTLCFLVFLPLDIGLNWRPFYGNKDSGI